MTPELYSLRSSIVSLVRCGKKGIPVSHHFIKLLSYFMDGNRHHLCRFNHLKHDEGNAALLATIEQHLVSSHSVKRFFDRFSFLRIYVFRQLLQRLFIWMLRQTNRSVIEFCIDTIVLNNDDARKRHGVQPTYKKDKGFHPLQMNWGRYMVDAVFR